MEFNEKLQELRKNKNLTQEQLAEQLYVSRTAISKWESGRGYPSIDSLKEISKY
ncbi:MAG: bacitracin resistance transcriptional activator BcrR, partial [Christensenella sp.]